MSKVTRLLLSTVFVALLSTGMPTADAQSIPSLEEGVFSQFTTIRHIRQNQLSGDNNTNVALNGVGCEGSPEFFIDATAPAYESMVDQALAAFLASRQVVVVHYGCRIQSLWVR